MARIVTFRHWFPRITICPVNNLPDLIYASVQFQAGFRDLYEVRKIIARYIPHFKRGYMEDFASSLFEAFPSAVAVEVRLAFNRHIIRITR